MTKGTDMITLTIQKNEANQRFDKFLKKRFHNAPSSFLYKMLRKKNIVLNGKKAEGREMLSIGDTVTCFFSEETFRKFEGAGEKEDWKTDPRYLPPDILYETEELLFFNKPPGMLSQKADESDFSANEQLLRYLYEKGALTDDDLLSFHPSVVNRLDRNTSGILIGGKTLAGLKTASSLLRERTLEKYYHAIVHGRYEKPASRDGWIVKDQKKNVVRFSEKKVEGAQHIRTDFWPIRIFRDQTLLSIRLHTGKSHQIRVHLASEGYPIIGDPKYGDRKKDRILPAQTNISRQMLHARQIILPDGETITAPDPEDFKRVLEAIEKVG